MGELCTRGDEFRVRWGAHDVQLHRTGLKHIQHSVAGELHLSYEVMDLPTNQPTPWKRRTKRKSRP